MENQYNFDDIINRKSTNALTIEGYKQYLFSGEEQLVLPCVDDDLIHMWVADMQFRTAPEIIQALHERITHGIFGYTMVFGDDYKDSFVSWVNRRNGWTPNKNQIVFSQGIVPALYDLISYICRPDEKALIFTPSYAYFKHAADFNHVELTTSLLVENKGAYSIDFEDFNQKARDPKTTLFILCNPHNPIGKIWTQEELFALGKICFENNVMIIADEIHCDVLRKGKNYTPMAKIFPESEDIITCMSPSKTFNLAGMMFANLIIPNDRIRNLWTEKHLGMENPLSIVAAQAAYTSGEKWLNALTNYLDENFKYLYNFLQNNLPLARFAIPDATYLAWIDLGAYFQKGDNLTLFFANQAGVLVEGGNMFVDNAEGYLRLNIACPRSVLEEGLNRISKAVNNC